MGDCDTVTGEQLPSSLVAEAKREEVDWLTQKGVYVKVPIEGAHRHHKEQQG